MANKLSHLKLNIEGIAHVKADYVRKTVTSWMGMISSTINVVADVNNRGELDE